MGYAAGGNRKKRAMLTRTVVEKRQDTIIDDKRGHTRYATRLEGRLLTLDCRHNFKCLITDLSEGGARVAAADFQLPSGKASLFVVRSGDILECDIRWQRAYEIGLRFIHSDSSPLNLCELEPIR